MYAKFNNNSKLLIIVDEKTKLDEVYLSEKSDYIDIVYHNKMDYYDILNYSSYAVENNIIQNDLKLSLLLSKEFDLNSSTIYIFGNVTITDYKNILGLETFGAYTYLYDQNGPTTNTAFMRFDENQEDNYVENIISFSKNYNSNHLIANFDFVEEPEFSRSFEYIKAIAENYIENNSIRPMATIVKSGFDFRIYTSFDGYVNMDYVLYRETNETDPIYDYFALRTNISAHSDDWYWNTVNAILMKHKGAYINNINILDYGPGTIYRASTVTVGLAFGDTVQGSIGWTFDVGGKPDIYATYSPVDESISWDIMQYWLFGGPLNDQLFKLGSSWASLSQKSSVAINTTFSGVFKSCDGILLYPTSQKTVNIIYDYCDGGSTHTHFHYRHYNALQHEKYCLYCNYSVLENHRWIHQPPYPSYCRDCFYESGIIINKLPLYNQLNLIDYTRNN